MKFSDAFEYLKAGKPIRCSSWKGYWIREDNTIQMYDKDGSIIGLIDTDDIFYTLSLTTRDDWELVKSTDFDVIKTYTFGEVIRLIQQGNRFSRKSWNGKNQFIYYTKSIKEKMNGEPINIHGHIDLKNEQDEIIVGWTPTQTDMFATDWVEIKENN